jgi:hypothetical protein
MGYGGADRCTPGPRPREGRFGKAGGRGVLRAGAPADIVVYDYDQLAIAPMEVVHDLPGGEWRRVQRANCRDPSRPPGEPYP